MKLSDYIKKYRKENNLTQSELAEKLYVTKQTISKWENDKGLPDVYLYPTLSELLNISIDELMGKDTTKESKIIKSKKIYLIIPITLIMIILIILSVVFLPKIIIKYSTINEAEEHLQCELPKVIDFGYIEFESVPASNIGMFPSKIYYLSFEDQIEISNVWKQITSEELLGFTPYFNKGYLDICNYFVLYNLTTNEINKLNTYEKEQKNEYELYCLDIDKNRIIVIYFIK